MQSRYRSAQGSPQGAQRRPPEGMPSHVPPKKPVDHMPPARESLPVQKAITDEPEPRTPARWKKIVKRVAAIVGLVLSLSLVYVFLLMGEPDEDDQLTQQNAAQEEIIRVPIAASQVAGDADLNPLAVNFGMPVMALYGSPLTLQKATLFDSAFRGNYARRLTLVYAFANGDTLTVESIRPTAAVALFGGERFSLNMQALYTVAGMDAVRMDSEQTVLILARGLDAAYAVVCPQSHVAELPALLKQLTMMQPATS